MSFLIPAAIGAVGSYLSGRGKANSNNKQNAYLTDQKRRDYEAARAKAEEDDTRRLDGIDALEAIALAKGYKIPPSAFEALKRRGAYKGMSAQDRIADVPKEGSSIWGALGGGLSDFAELSGQAALRRSGQPPLPAAATRAPSTYDGGEEDLVDYYRRMLPGGGGTGGGGGEFITTNTPEFASMPRNRYGAL